MVDNNTKDGGRSWVTAASIGLLLATFYFLSIGPAWVAHKNGIISKPTLEFVYLPFVWLAGKLPPVSNVVGWYCEACWQFWNLFS